MGHAHALAVTARGAEVRGTHKAGDRVMVRYAEPSIFDNDHGQWLAATVRHERWNGGLGGFWDVVTRDGREMTVGESDLRRETPK